MKSLVRILNQIAIDELGRKRVRRRLNPEISDFRKQVRWLKKYRARTGATMTEALKIKT